LDASQTASAAVEAASVLITVTAAPAASPQIPWWGVPAFGVGGAVVGAVVAGFFALRSARLTSDRDAVERDKDRSAAANAHERDLEQAIRLANHASAIEAYRAVFRAALSVEQTIRQAFDSHGGSLSGDECRELFDANSELLVGHVDTTKGWLLHCGEHVRALVIDYFDYAASLLPQCEQSRVEKNDFLAELNSKAAELQSAMRQELGLESVASEASAQKAAFPRWDVAAREAATKERLEEQRVLESSMATHEIAHMLHWSTTGGGAIPVAAQRLALMEYGSLRGFEVEPERMAGQQPFDGLAYDPEGRVVAVEVKIVVGDPKSKVPALVHSVTRQLRNLEENLPPGSTFALVLATYGLDVQSREGLCASVRQRLDELDLRLRLDVVAFDLRDLAAKYSAVVYDFGDAI